jgi:hypothetical protein
MMEAADLRQFHHTPEFRWLKPSWAPAYLYLALSESGSGDNNPGSFSGWLGDAFLRE